MTRGHCLANQVSAVSNCIKIVHHAHTNYRIDTLSTHSTFITSTVLLTPVLLPLLPSLPPPTTAAARRLIVVIDLCVCVCVYRLLRRLLVKQADRQERKRTGGTYKYILLMHPSANCDQLIF